MNLSKDAILTLSVLLLALNVKAQHVNFEWARSFGSPQRDESSAIALDSKGNVYVTGYFQDTMVVGSGTSQDTLISNGPDDIYLCKYDPSGNHIWAKRMGGESEYDYGLAIIVDTADNVYVAGCFGESADFNPDGSGGILTAIGFADMFLAKYDSSGNYLWSQSVGTNVTMGLTNYGIAIDKASNDVLIAGTFNGSGDFDPGIGIATLTATGTYDMFMAKFTHNGDYIWAKNIGGNGAVTLANALSLDSSGNIYVTGSLRGSANFNPGGSGGMLTAVGRQDVFLAKYDRDGNYHWAKNMGGNNQDIGYGIVVDGKGGIYITGLYKQGNTPADFNLGGSGGDVNNNNQHENVFLAKYDSGGNYLWVNDIGGSGKDIGYGVAVDRSDNVYVTGCFSYSVDFNPYGNGDTLTTVGDGIDREDNDVFVVKYDSSGTYIWSISMGSNIEDRGKGIVIDDRNNIYLTGWFSEVANFNPNGLNGELEHAGEMDVFVAKLSQGCELYTSFIESACDSFSFNEITYDESGIYRDTFPSVNNCDSIVVLDLTITGYTSDNPILTGDYCDSVTFNGITYDSSGTYTQQYSNSTGCDSTITYDLTIGKSNTGELTLSSCDSLVLNDDVYTASGTYTQVLTNASGCDSTLTIELTINSSPQASVVLNGSTLTANSADSYQWVDCDDDYALIADATQQSFTPTETGNYAVTVTTDDGCSDTSECTFVEAAGSSIDQLGLGNTVQVYPNPAKSQINIQTQQRLHKADIRLVNMLGQVLEEQINQKGNFFTLDMSPYTSGIYFVDINEAGNTVRVKIVKE